MKNRIRERYKQGYVVCPRMKGTQSWVLGKPEVDRARCSDDPKNHECLHIHTKLMMIELRVAIRGLKA